MIKEDKVFNNSYVFAGPSGTGKTTTARILARAMLCENVRDNGDPCNECDSCQTILEKGESPSFKEVDAANHSGKENIQRILKDSQYYTLDGKERRIYLIDECFTEDTELLTEDGLKSIKEIVEEEYGGRVLSYDEESGESVWKPVTDWFDVGEKETIRLEFDNNVELEVTLDQEIYTNNRGWVEARNLTSEDDVNEEFLEDVSLPSNDEGLVPCACGCGSEINPVDSRGRSRMFASGHGGKVGRCIMAKLIDKERQGKKKVYDVSVKDTHNFFAASRKGCQSSMILAHNCHRLSKTAMDALLKPMEDTIPGKDEKRFVCLFCTTEPEKLRKTIKTRCMVFQIKDPARDEVIDRMAYICDQEGIPYDDEALNLIFDYGEGHIRDMMNAIEKVSHTGDLSVDRVQEQLGLSSLSNYYRILLSLGDDLERAFEIVDETLRLTDPKSIYEGIARVAMSSYRLSYGVTVDIGYVEEGMAEEINDKYGDDLLWIVQYMLDTEKTITEEVLLSDLLAVHRFLEGNPVPDQKKIPVRESSGSGECENDKDRQTDDDQPDDQENEEHQPDEEAASYAEAISKYGSQGVNKSGVKRYSSSDGESETKDPSSTSSDVSPPDESKMRDFINDDVF